MYHNLFVALSITLCIFSVHSDSIKLPLSRRSLKNPVNHQWRITDNGLSKVPLQGSVEAFGEYFVTVGLGSPAVSFDFQVDTGSTDLLVYGQTCSGCPKDALKFDPSKSTTAAPVACASNKYTCDTTKCYQPGNFCPFDDAYGDGSDVRGYVLVDEVTIGGASAVVSLGIIQSSSAQFEPTGVDGIFGLASPYTSSWGAESPLIELLQQSGAYKSFGMCLQQDGGSLSLGVNENSNPNVKFTKAVLYKGALVYYPVNITDVQIDGKSLKLKNNVMNGDYGALVDSGTTLMIFPSPVVNGMKAAFKAACNRYQLPGICGVPDGQTLFDGNCFPMTDTDRANFPVFKFSLDQLSDPLVVTNKEYLIYQNASSANTQDSYVWCLGVQASPAGQTVTILGDTFMRGFYVVFDSETQSVGFGPQSACP